jgi:HAD superfamily hydrolase (TIGR01484 family)
MKYKAVICDVDGTLMENRFEAMPSEKVTQVIQKASRFIHIGIATSRPYYQVSHIIDHLNLSGPSIIHGGSQIIDTSSGKILKEHKFKKEELQEAYEIVKKYGYKLNIDQDGKMTPVESKPESDDVLGTVIWRVDEGAEKLIKELSKISTINLYKIVSWEKGRIDLSISPLEGTKQHGILEVANILGIKTHEIIGIGDGYNDFPLLMACGLKVAMGNAVPELKEIADYIAPTVEEDGVAKVLEKFVLRKAT